MGTVAENLTRKLREAFAPDHLAVIDDSARHAGHSGSRDGGESHFEIVITSAAFAGLGRVARQRLIYTLLAEELAGPVHALALTVRAPGEA